MKTGTKRFLIFVAVAVVLGVASYFAAQEYPELVKPYEPVETPGSGGDN